MTPVSDTALDSLHAEAAEIFTGALEACNIESAFDRRLRFEGNTVRRLIPDGSGPDTISLSKYKRIFVIALGKAAAPMLEVLLDRMKRRNGLRGICCSKYLPKKRNWRFRYFEGGHPVPNEESFDAARATLAMLKKAKKDTLIFFLISGGGSAMFDLPLDSQIGLEETIAFHQALLASGAPINEINTLRKHFSLVKGGRLAIAAPEAMKVSLLLPDVPLRALDALSSGPTSPDHSTVADVRDVLKKYDLAPKLPSSVRAFFERGDLPESPGNKDWRQSFLPKVPSLIASNVRTFTGAEAMSGELDAFRDSVFELLLSSHDLVESARALAEKAGFFVAVDNSCDDWDYAEAARYLLERFHEMRGSHKRFCLISVGEVTVTLNRAPGAGGRNQQFALQCALDLARHPGELITVLSAGSDGIDGNTRSAGAIADTTTVERARAFGFNPEESLQAFNACPLFTSLGDAIVTGPTGQNLRDLRLLMADHA
ncbi:MAG: glycerate kinase [Terracidiphilus sp.]